MSKIFYKDGYKYQLAEFYECYVSIFPEQSIVTDYVILDSKGILSINKGYAWDGPSGPTIDTRNFMRGSLIHDALYQLMRENLLSRDCREDADMELKKACLEDGMSKIRAWYVYRSVRRLAAFAANPGNVKKLLSAP